MALASCPDAPDCKPPSHVLVAFRRVWRVATGPWHHPAASLRAETRQVRALLRRPPDCAARRHGVRRGVARHAGAKASRGEVHGEGGVEIDPDPDATAVISSPPRRGRRRLGAKLVALLPDLLQGLPKNPLFLDMAYPCGYTRPCIRSCEPTCSTPGLTISRTSEPRPGSRFASYRLSGAISEIASRSATAFPRCGSFRSRLSPVFRAPRRSSLPAAMRWRQIHAEARHQARQGNACGIDGVAQ